MRDTILLPGEVHTKWIAVNDLKVSNPGQATSSLDSCILTQGKPLTASLQVLQAIALASQALNKLSHFAKQLANSYHRHATLRMHLWQTEHFGHHKLRQNTTSVTLLVTGLGIVVSVSRISWSHLKIGLSMAQLSAAPLDTHSFAFSVLPGSLPKKSLMILSNAGTRELPPTISTECNCSWLILASSSACNCSRQHETHAAQ